MKIVMSVLLEDVPAASTSTLIRCIRQEFHFEGITILPATDCRVMEFTGVLSLDEPVFSWCKQLTYSIWKTIGHFLSVRYNFHRLLDDARVYPKYVKFDFDDEGEHDAMKIYEQLSSSRGNNG